MKKLYYLIIALLVVTAACTSDKNGSVDAEAITIDSIMSPDLAFAQLRGDVKKCVTTTTEARVEKDSLVAVDDPIVLKQTLTFDKQGQILKLVTDEFFGGELQESLSYIFEYENGKFSKAYTSADDALQVVRNEDGYVTVFSLTGSTGGIEFKNGYAWNGKHLAEERLINNDVIKDEDNEVVNMNRVTNKTEYTYDNEGFLVGSVEENGDPAREYTTTVTTYKILDMDSHGNWTKRTVSKKSTGYQMSGSVKEDIEPQESYSIETREIQYYE